MSNEYFGFNTTQAKSLENKVAELQAQIDALNAWATALATKLNADFTAQNALNAFPLTLDTNYDTDPQA